MIERILVAVDDSPASLAAARQAVVIAAEVGARLRVVHVVANHLVADRLEHASHRPHAVERRELSGAAVLARVESMARSRDVDVDASTLSGAVAPAILHAARSWGADLLVLGRCGRPVEGESYLGRDARQVLEFAECPVLVVPARRAPGHPGAAPVAN